MNFFLIRFQIDVELSVSSASFKETKPAAHTYLSIFATSGVRLLRKYSQPKCLKDFIQGNGFTLPGPYASKSLPRIIVVAPANVPTTHHLFLVYPLYPVKLSDTCLPRIYPYSSTFSLFRNSISSLFGLNRDFFRISTRLWVNSCVLPAPFTLSTGSGGLPIHPG